MMKEYEEYDKDMSHDLVGLVIGMFFNLFEWGRKPFIDKLHKLTSNVNNTHINIFG